MPDSPDPTALVEPPRTPASTDATLPRLGAELLALQRSIVQWLGQGHRDAGWLRHHAELAERTCDLLRQDRDNLLYLLAQDAQRSLEGYSGRHALFCAVVGMVCAEQLDCTGAEVQWLVQAALSMNLSMAALQDELSFRERTLTVEQRLCIEDHPRRSADALREAGVDDPAWLEIVERHHEELPADATWSALSVPQQLAGLLHRADVFTAKVSARKTRAALPATAAARDACLGPDGRPDRLGTALVRALGIYPPGSYVKLASGEIAVVRRRGARIDEPLVMSLVGRDGRALATPVARHTGQAGHAVKGAVRPIDTRAVADHLKSGSLGG